MKEWKLLGNLRNEWNGMSVEQKDNAPDETNDKIEPVEMMLKDYHAPEDLKLRTLGAMEKMRRDQRRRKNAVTRVAAAAAIVVATVSLTPLSGCVKNVAESAYDAMRNWFQNTTHQGYKLYADGCEVELIETTLVNDFLYVTLDESFEGYLDYYRTRWVSYNEDWEVVSEGDYGDYTAEVYDRDGAQGHDMSVRLSGELYDDRGHTLPFTAERVNEVDKSVGTDDGYNHSVELYERVHTYRVWLPDIDKVVTSKNGKYFCRLCVTATDNDTEVSRMEFNDVRIDDASAVHAAKEYPLNYSYTLENMRFDFQKLSVGRSESNILVECTPLGAMAEDISQAKDEMYDDIFNTALTVYQVTPELENGRLDYMLSSDLLLMDENDFSRKVQIGYQDATKNPIVFSGKGLLRQNGKYYMILTYKVNSRKSPYRYDDLISAAKDGGNCFRVLDMYYHYENYEAEQDEDGNWIPFDDDYDSNLWCVYRTYAEEQTMGMRTAAELEAKAAAPDDSVTVDSSLNSQSATVDFGALKEEEAVSRTFRAGSYTIDVNISGYDIEVERIYDGDRLIFSIGNGYEKSPIVVSDMIFAVERDGKALTYYDSFSSEYISNNYHSSWKMYTWRSDDDLIELDKTCTVTLASFKCRLRGSDEAKYVMYVDPKFYNAQGVSMRELEAAAAIDAFEKHNSFGVASGR